MQPNKIKKLSLNKKTIANLEDIDMKEVQGGRVVISIVTIAQDTCLCTISIGPKTVCGDCWTYSAYC
ncbi:class I lanthipeptide [Acidobacteriota bacterium]